MGPRVFHSVSWLMALTIGVLMHVCICAPARAASAGPSRMRADHACCRHVKVKASDRAPSQPCRECPAKARTVIVKPAPPAAAPALGLAVFAQPVMGSGLVRVAGDMGAIRGEASVPDWLPPPDLVHCFCQLTV